MRVAFSSNLLHPIGKILIALMILKGVDVLAICVVMRVSDRLVDDILAFSSIAVFNFRGQ